MNPEEKELLRRSIELSNENNKILKSMHKSMRWGQFWGFIKLLAFVIPLILGYIYLHPYLGSILDTYKEVQGTLNLRPGAEKNNL